MSRVLNDELETYLKTESPNRDYLLSYIKSSLKNGRESVALCFRGNYATMYYRCHQLLRIRRVNDSIIGEFDYRHSRFSKDFKEKLELLHSYGVDVSGFDKNNKNRRFVRFVLEGENAVTKDNLAKILEVYKQLINDFLNPELKVYQYDIPPTATDAICRRKTKNIEKDKQQQLYADYFYNTEETFYDLEYTEPNAKDKKVAGRIDLLGIKHSADGFNLELVELKSTRAACDGPAGIKKHEGDYIKYRESSCVEERKQDACSIMKLLHELLDKPAFDDLTVQNMGVTVKFIFTDEAAERGKSYKPQSGIIKEIK